MHALLAANPWLGIEEANLQHLNLFFAAVAALGVILLILRGLARLREKNRERQQAWKNFRVLAKARGFSTDQIRALSVVARLSRLTRPSQMLGSIQVFDRSIQRAQERSQLSETQQILLDSIRRKLVSAKGQWTGNNQRQLQRVPCAFRLQFSWVGRDDVDKEMLKRGETDQTKIQEKIETLAAGMAAEPGKVQDISAGGLALVVRARDDGTDMRPGDYVRLAVDPEKAPVNLNGLHAEIREVQDLEEERALVLHLRFMPFDGELRRAIIQLVYAEQEKAKKKPRKKRRPAAAPKPVETHETGDTG